MKTIFLIFTLLLLLLSGCSNENTNQESNYKAQRQLAETSNTTENSHNTTESVNTTNANTNSTSQASHATSELYRYATTIYTKTEERQNNVKLCCQQLNGHVVSSGETFSFCDTLRSSNPRRGLSKS